MKVLYYTWGENSREDMLETFLALGIAVTECQLSFCDYEKDGKFVRQIKELIQEQQCDLIFSFDFFPLMVQAAEELEVKYISWIYDCPHLPLFSPRVRSSCNHIFIFDKMLYERVKNIGGHVYHMPLAVNTDRLNRQLSLPDMEHGYSHEVSFVGSLYETNFYDQILYLPLSLQGYLDGVMAAQRKLYGCSLVRELLTAPVMAEVERYVSLNLDPAYFMEARDVIADMIHAKLTCMERTGILNQAAEKYRLTLCTGSDASLVPKAEHMGGVSYQMEMPVIFRDSKINLNISLRSIESGIPLRALDIMGAGGFLLSNYQQELADEFEDGRELVMFESEEDMMEKIGYYLEHEQERREIARRGWRKVQKRFSYKQSISRMLELADGEGKEHV